MSDPLPPDDHEKPLQPESDVDDLEHGDPVEDAAGQDAIWAEGDVSEQDDDQDDPAGP